MRKGEALVKLLEFSEETKTWVKRGVDFLERETTELFHMGPNRLRFDECEKERHPSS